MQVCDMKSVDIYVDNQGAVALDTISVYRHRAKHYNIRYHFVRSESQKGDNYTLD